VQGAGAPTAEQIRQQKTRAIAQALMNKHSAPFGQAAALEMMKTRESYTPVAGPGGNVIGQRSNLTGKVEPFPQADKPQYGVIGQDQYGTPQYGFIDPMQRRVTPTQLPGMQPSGQPSVLPPVPAGVDPKAWREEATKRFMDQSGEMPGTAKEAAGLRAEIRQLPSYKNVAEALPVFKSMHNAAGRDTRASDVNLIYGMAKIMDPGSVVRESEMSVAQAIATLPQRLRAEVSSQIASTGRLSPEVRQGIMEEAYSRIEAYKQVFDSDAGMYRGIATRGRIRHEDVIPDWGKVSPYKPAGSDIIKRNLKQKYGLE
jgi:hypothetical protein